MLEGGWRRMREVGQGGTVGLFRGSSTFFERRSVGLKVIACILREICFSV